VNLYKPTNAGVVPSRFDLALGKLLGLRTLVGEESSTYIKLNTQTPYPPRGAVPVNQGRHRKIFHFCTASSPSVMNATPQAMSPKCSAKRQQKAPANIFDARFDSGVNGSASGQQVHIRLFRVPFQKGVKLSPASNGLGQINKSAHRPNVSLPFLAASDVESETKISAHDRAEICQAL
jgi:hypothetical protein